MSLHDAACTLTVKRKRGQFTPEWREKLSEAMRRRWADPAYREAQIAKIMAKKRSPAGRAAQSKKLRRYYDNPEGGLKWRAQALRERIAKLQKKLAEWDRLLGND